MGNSITEHPISIVSPTSAPVRERANGLGYTGWLLLVIVWSISLGYGATVLYRGWQQPDEGLLAQSAERVLEGQVPHRDFQDMYTGGLSYLHAFGFKLLGTNLSSLRVVLFIFFAVWIPVVYWIASRITDVKVAAGATLLAVAWSVPNYPASLPSWYNLFFATFGTAALVRYLEVGSTWWLILAGLSAGVSCLFKITGFYFVAAALLFFVFHQQYRTLKNPGGKAVLIYHAFITLSLLAFLTLIVSLLRARWGAAEVYHFLLPQLALTGVLLFQEWTQRTRAYRRPHGANVVSMSAPFLFGVLIPIGLFVIGYVYVRALPQLINGIFVLPTKRLSNVFRSAPLEGIVPMLLMLYLIYKIAGERGRKRWILEVGLALMLAGAIWAADRWESIFLVTWYSIAALIPMIVVLAAIALLRSENDKVHNQQLMLLAAVLSVCSLVQFPFSNVGYYCYVAPLMILAISALLRLRAVPRSTLSIIFAVFLLFPVLVLRPRLGRNQYPPANLVQLETPRAGGLMVREDEAREYDDLVRLVQEHAEIGSYIYAAPNSPEV